MKTGKVFLLDVHRRYLVEDIIYAILSNLYPHTITNRIEEADIVIRGVYVTQPEPLSYFRKIKNFLRYRINGEADDRKAWSIREIYDPKRKKIWIHVSGEAPNNTPYSSFLNSECDYGIGHETIAHKNYVRMPHWYQSIDWSDMSFQRNKEAYYRLGRPIKVNELTTGISSTNFKRKNKRIALISSHMSSPRDVLVSQISKFMPVDIYGVNGPGPAQYRSNLNKRDMLREYSAVLAPENRLHPGYITEKVPEAFACGAFPIGWYLQGVKKEFTFNSHLNLADYGALAISDGDEISSIFENNFKRMNVDGLPPLLDKEPNLEYIVSLLKRVVSSLR